MSALPCRGNGNNKNIKELKMRIFETRHGQVAPKGFYKNNPSLPIGDVALSTLGKEQALLLAKRLKQLNFNGLIFSSPYDRTMKTASIIAEELGLSITPLACMHEIVSKVDENFSGATVEELKKRYPRVRDDAELPARWWGDSVENLSAVIERVKEGLEPVLSSLPNNSDVLLVGHAATSVALRHLFACTDNRGFHWNCHLSLLYDSTAESYTNDCTHLPKNFWTGNSIVYDEQKKRFEDGINTFFSRISDGCAQTVLHIGDTSSSDYGYYKTLIENVKPDVIIHTGDLADELKAGRIESVRAYWKVSARVILNIMEQSGARVIIVAGNNDLEQELKSMSTKSEIAPRNTILEFFGKKVLLCHEINRMDENAEAEVFLYGHGLTGETRTVEDNERNGKLYFNATWGASLHDFKQGINEIIPKTYL